VITAQPGPISRRRALVLVAGGACASISPRAARAEAPRRWVWRGTALGAPAELVLYHPDRDVAERALSACLVEVDRLEGDFSLYRSFSAISRLNRDGALAAPSLDMLAVLDDSRAVSVASGGAFDVTVQPLWRLYADHFAARPHDEGGPTAAELERALSLVDQRRLLISPDRIALASGMAMTLNGIAQGYITDRIADLLRDSGWSNVLINLGEIRTLGGHPDRTPWTIGLDRPANARRPMPKVRITNRAVATSSGAHTVFTADGRHHHLLDPRTGRSATTCSQVTVTAPRATVADALSTALFIVPPEARTTLLHPFAQVTCLIVETNGQLTRLGT
jgi:FAD:protein FMN transferase